MCVLFCYILFDFNDCFYCRSSLFFILFVCIFMFSFVYIQYNDIIIINFVGINVRIWPLLFFRPDQYIFFYFLLQVIVIFFFSLSLSFSLPIFFVHHYNHTILIVIIAKYYQIHAFIHSLQTYSIISSIHSTSTFCWRVTFFDFVLFDGFYAIIIIIVINILFINIYALFSTLYTLANYIFYRSLLLLLLFFCDLSLVYLWSSYIS